MFYHVKDLQYNARVSAPDPRFARLLLEQFGGSNGELKAAMQYFVQAFSCRNPFPEKYDMLMDIATEELGHLEIVGATIQMLQEVGAKGMFYWEPEGAYCFSNYALSAWQDDGRPNVGMDAYKEIEIAE